MKRSIHLMLLSISVILVLTLSSCNLPFKIVPNDITPTPAIPENRTPQPPSATPQAPTATLDQTPTPDNMTSLADLVPVTGSILKWIDLSDFVYVPAGEFLMGQDETTPSDHAPAHKVTLSGFWIQQAEVTNQQYAQCVADGKCSAPNQEPKTPYWYLDALKASDPVVGVTWFQAQEYCTYINSRLPTESEWELTARGFESKAYPWGTDQPDCSLLDFNNCLDPSEPEEVRSYNNGASDFEAMDMSGNVFEWTGDWYLDTYYETSPATNPTGPQEGTKKVYRGGGFNSPLEEVNPILRFAIEPEKHAANIGFRCVLLGDPTKSTTETVGQPCQVLGSNDELKTQPTFTPYPCEPASVLGYCELLGGKASYGVDIRQKGCMSNKLNSMTGNSQPLTCSVHQLANGGNQFLCTFPGMAQGISVDVRYCHPFFAQPFVIECPSGYKLNQTSKVCELEYTKLPSPPCPNGYLDVPPNGCMPLNDPNKGGCPVGYYSIVSPLTSVCMPINSCLLSNAPASCINPTCGAGEFFDTAKGCCASPDTPKKFCPANLLYNADQNACIGSDMYPHECPVEKVKIPYCPTLTPTPSPTPVPKQNCYCDPKIVAFCSMICD